MTKISNNELIIYFVSYERFKHKLKVGGRLQGRCVMNSCKEINDSIELKVSQRI